MPSAKDIKLDDNTSFLLIGHGGTKKTTFISTCPKPVFIFDCDNGMAVLRGKDGIDYETYREIDKGASLTPWQMKQGGWYEWGTAYLKLKAELNKIGSSMDTGECKYRTLAIDSITLFYDLLFSHTEKEHGVYKDGRQQWGDVLKIATIFFSQFTCWPVVKVVTAHVQVDENKISQVVEKLPLIGGQFAGKAQILFDEVYYTENKGGKATLRSMQEGSFAQAKSRKYNIPDGTELDYNKIMEIVRKEKVHAA
jgi:hypothetical protein